jgi:hypothetical protein
MLGPIVLQAAKVISQFLSRNPIFLRIGSRYIGSGQAERDYKKWYKSLSPEGQKRVDDAILWVVKDLAGDIIQAYVSVPIPPLVDKVFDVLVDITRNSDAEQYVESELKRKLKQRIP